MSTAEDRAVRRIRTDAFVFVALVAAGCGEAPERTLELSGRIEGWTRGGGYMLDTGLGPQAAGPVSEDGSFRVPLPTGAELSAQVAPFPVMAETCAEFPRAVPPGTRVLQLLQLRARAEGLPDLLVHHANRPFLATAGDRDGFVMVTYRFAERDVVISGKVECAFIGPPGQQALDFKRGWNVQVNRYAGSDPRRLHVESVSEDPPPEARWWAEEPSSK